MMPLAAYADRLSVRPGQTIRFHVANATGADVDARLARVICADANPAGPGIQVEALDGGVRTLAAPAPQKVPHGSYAIVDGVDDWFAGGSFTLVCRVFPTLLEDAREQALLARVDRVGRGIALQIGADGCVRAQMGGGRTFESARCDKPLAVRRWYQVWMSFDVETRRLQVGNVRLHVDAAGNRGVNLSEHELGADANPVCTGPLLMAD